jgi:iron complex transport system ATP-binding protein
MASETAVKTSALTYRHNGSFRLSGINMEVRPGEFFGIAGPNGCGKTTLLRLLSGALVPLEGEVELCGKAPSAMSARECARIMAFLPAEMAVSYDFTVKEIAVMGRAPHARWWKDYSSQDYAAAQETLCALGLAAALEKPINALSSGERRKVFIAQAICQQPKVLLLDEPTSHLDLKCQIDTFSLLAALAKKSGTTIVAVSHDIAMLMRYCDRILLLKTGSMAACGTPEEAITAGIMRTVYGVETQLLRGEDGEPQLFLKKPQKSL